MANYRTGGIRASKQDFYSTTISRKFIYQSRMRSIQSGKQSPMSNRFSVLTFTLMLAFNHTLKVSHCIGIHINIRLSIHLFNTHSFLLHSIPTDLLYFFHTLLFLTFFLCLNTFQIIIYSF